MEKNEYFHLHQQTTDVEKNIPIERYVWRFSGASLE